METDPCAILNTWNDRNTVLQITDPLSFISRIKDAVAEKENSDIVAIHAGPVTYDKDAGSHRAHHWVEGIFQKNMRYNSQKEFRIALTGITRIAEKPQIVLNIGDCSEIARIIESPNHH